MIEEIYILVYSYISKIRNMRGTNYTEAKEKYSKADITKCTGQRSVHKVNVSIKDNKLVCSDFPYNEVMFIPALTNIISLWTDTSKETLSTLKKHAKYSHLPHTGTRFYYEEDLKECGYIVVCTSIIKAAFPPDSEVERILRSRVVMNKLMGIEEIV